MIRSYSHFMSHYLDEGILHRAIGGSKVVEALRRTAVLAVAAMKCGAPLSATLPSGS